MQDFYSITPIFKQKNLQIVPVFIPFAGCKKRCIFCAQHYQTGRASKDLDNVFSITQNMLESAFQKKEKIFELAFYGGTFTLLPDLYQEKLLALGHKYIKKGVVSSLRCSTRPDAVTPEQLLQLKKFGVKTVELGVQSFNDHALNLSGRGYSGQQAEDACRQVKQAGLDLVVQLMPGMPGVDAEIFRLDVNKSISLSPGAMRLYPCLVIDNTPLAKLWRRGEFAPWNAEETKKELGMALRDLWTAKIPVIRIGLAPEESLLPHILDGPWHPAMGNQIQAQAFYLWLKDKIKCLPGRLIGLNIPSRLQGAFWGHRGELKQAYEILGVTPKTTSYWKWPLIRLRALSK